MMGVPGRPAITDLGFRAQKLRAGPRERGRDEDGQCGGPALPARAGSGGADARTFILPHWLT